MAVLDAKLILCTPVATVHLGRSRHETIQTTTDSNAIYPAIRANLP